MKKKGEKNSPNSELDNEKSKIVSVLYEEDKASTTARIERLKDELMKLEK